MHIVVCDACFEDVLSARDTVLSQHLFGGGKADCDEATELYRMLRKEINRMQEAIQFSEVDGSQLNESSARNLLYSIGKACQCVCVESSSVVGML